MTRLRLVHMLGLCAGLLALPSCRPSGEPVLNVDRAIYKNHGQLDLDTIREKIVAGLDRHGWGVVDEAKGWMVAEVRSDENWVRVRITYDANHYSIIHFESSPEFKYDGARIHRRYNGWIENLDEAIADQFLEDPDAEAEPEVDDDDDSLDQIASEPAAAAAATAPPPAVEAAPPPADAPPPAAPPEAPPG